ncbi:MAG: hypothetical protein Q4F05_01600 [bacterium]|nr:hypothetical protein [bacterium]
MVYIGDIFHCPPAMTVIQTLSDLNYEVKVCTNKFDVSETVDTFANRNNVEFKFVANKYNKEMSVFEKFTDMFTIRKRIWSYINEEKDNDSLIWVVAGGTVKFLGKELLCNKYILHLLELTEDLYYLESKHKFKISRQFAKRASAIVECEYNRAHITKAWWELDELPFVLPNKPYKATTIDRYSSITNNEKIATLMKSLENKKVILYQGNISKERPLEPFLKAVEALGDPYVFVAMINGENPFPSYKGNQYYHIPFVIPPYHLEITSHAYIGILTYTPIKNDYSILNTLYCAPNKIWEYSMFSVPVISNDLPALRNQFEKYSNGVCFEEFEENEIKEAIINIDENYDTYSNASKEYFNSLDINKRISHIIKCVLKKKD